ncbi:hypothetical protein HHK36_017692 [Tetracentron sinense]|uniref:TTF-type domain-containing protein n=1 Tax=Tetracentron sinense TaxID=13715 RepID=A0A834YX98_TETSI|nr:hypothetical protein HHK36_017692 [Tetracentron sinense]
MVKSSTIDAFFKRKASQSSKSNSSSPTTNLNTSSHDRPLKVYRIEHTEVDINSLVHDPGLRLSIWDYPIDQRDKIRRAYIKAGPYQHILPNYPPSGPEKHRHRFQSSWFKLFPSWLEYSPSKDASFCLSCYLFTKKPTERPGSSAFTIEGFRNWKKVNDGENCGFLSHVGKYPNSLHNVAEQACKDLMSQSQHIEKIIEKQTSEQVVKNRLRLKTSIDTIRWLTFQACAFRGHDERPESKNRGNFLEMIKILASYNERVSEVVLENAPGNAKYTSPMIQKEILHILSSNVRNAIREEISDAKFCIIVDEARDESKREQMALVLRFVDKDGFLRERFFDIVHVLDTVALTLKKRVCAILSRHSLSIQNIRGQGYDGASNMRGEWNGSQALFLKDCPFAYYIHCFAHRLQLALVAASKEVKNVYHFFTKLTTIVNIVGVSCKRHDELQVIQAEKIAHLLAIDEIESSRGLNQIGTLQRAGDTRWSSHFNSVCSLIKMFDATCSILRNIITDGSTYSQRGDADAAYDTMTSFEFIFILHLMQEIMGITDNLCQALQSQSQDILNALDLVSTTKVLIQELREDGWDPLLEKVTSFCNQYNVDIPDMNGRYAAGRGRFHHQHDHITIEHHYKFDIFTATIDSQLQELNRRFNEHTMELLVLSSALDPRDNYKSFRIDDICKLVDKFYPQDFTEQEKIHLRYELQHYERDIPQHPELRNMLTISKLCQGLVKTGKSVIYPLVDRLIRLVLTLPVSTATTERAFSAMKIVKTRLRNKMEDEFLADTLVVNIEKEIAEKFTTESIIEDFYSMKERRAQLQ